MHVLKWESTVTGSSASLISSTWKCSCFTCAILWPLLVNGEFPHWQFTKLQYHLQWATSVFVKKWNVLFFLYNSILLSALYMYMSQLYTVSPVVVFSVYYT